VSHQISFLRTKPSAEDVSSKRGADNINTSCSKKPSADNVLVLCYKNPSAEMKDTPGLACARNIKNGNSEDSVLRHKTHWAAQA
jgi:hypothetical protein